MNTMNNLRTENKVHRYRQSFQKAPAVTAFWENTVVVVSSLRTCINSMIDKMINALHTETNQILVYLPTL